MNLDININTLKNTPGSISLESRDLQQKNSKIQKASTINIS